MKGDFQMKRLSGKRHEMPVRRFRGTMQSREGTNGPRCLKTLWSGGKAEPPGVAFLQKKAERVQFKDDNHGMSIPAEYTQPECSSPGSIPALYCRHRYADVKRMKNHNHGRGEEKGQKPFLPFRQAPQS